MKINEVEKITGIQDKTIRYYEQEGLLKTKRNENNYREFCTEDVEKLKQIKLMRSLGITLADIKRYLAKDVSLKDVLQQHIAELQLQMQEIDDRQELCKLMKEKDVPMVSEVVESYQKIKNKELGDEVKYLLDFRQGERNRWWIIRRLFLYWGILTMLFGSMLYLVIICAIETENYGYDGFAVVVAMMLLSFFFVCISLRTDAYQFREDGLYYSQEKNRKFSFKLFLAAWNGCIETCYDKVAYEDIVKVKVTFEQVGTTTGGEDVFVIVYIIYLENDVLRFVTNIFTPPKTMEMINCILLAKVKKVVDPYRLMEAMKLPNEKFYHYISIINEKLKPEGRQNMKFVTRFRDTRK